MAIQMTPLIVVALRYGSAALVGFAAAQLVPRGRFPRAVEAEMDAAPSGLGLRRARGQVSATARMSRKVRLGRFGPGIRMDATALARFRIRRLT